MTQETHDTVYQGRVHLIQAADGFRAGTDSLLLAAALTRPEGGRALEMGCGSGGALLPAAFRLSGARFVGLDADADAVDLARRGVIANRFEARVTLETGEASAWAKTRENQFDLVFSNPPYFEPGRISDPAVGKQNAYLEALPLEDWLKAMLFVARPRAPVVVIHRAADLARLLVPLDRQAGDITVLPIASKPGEEARRVLVRARKGLKRGPIRLLSPLVTHGSDGTPSDALASIRRGEEIAW